MITASGAPPPSKQVQVIISSIPWYFVITIPPHHRDQLAQSATRRMQSSELALELAEKWDMYFIVLSLSVSDQLSSTLDNQAPVLAMHSFRSASPASMELVISSEFQLDQHS